MAHPHMVGGFRMQTTPAFGTPAMAKPRPIRGKISDGRHRVLLVVLRVGFHTGRGSHEHTGLPGSVHHDQEELC